LSEANILELGAGTGMLAIALSSLCQSYTASDLLLNLKVVSRNLLLNNKPDVHLEEIDWVDISSNPPKTNPPVNDLILAVDCIYNEYLASPLVDTLSYYCPNGSKTVVLVVVELRSPDVVSSLDMYQS
jgi:predicted nicotinamide N-methyase